MSKEKKTNWGEYAMCLAYAAQGAEQILHILSSAPHKATRSFAAGQLIMSGCEGGRPIIFEQHPVREGRSTVAYNSRLWITQVPDTTTAGAYCVISIAGKMDGASIKVKLEGPVIGMQSIDRPNKLWLLGELTDDTWTWYWAARFAHPALEHRLGKRGFAGRPPVGMVGPEPISDEDLETFGNMISSYLAG